MDQLSYPCGRAGKKYINRKATAAQKNWIYSEINESRATPKSIERDYCFKQDTVEKWVAQKNKGVVFTDLMGRPPLLDEKNVAALTNKMTETSYKPTDRNYAETLHQQMQINAQEHNKSLSSISYPTRDTKRRYKVKIIAKSGKGKKTTAARATAVADIRNAISFGVMNQIMVNELNYIMIPFVLNLKRIHALDVNSATWYQLDGEEMQIRCYEDISMLSVLENNNINIGKPSGSRLVVKFKNQDI